MNLRLYFRHYQTLNEQFQPVIYSGPNPASIVSSPGTVPITDWVEVTDDVENVEALHLTFTLLQGDTSTDPKANRIQKAASETLTVIGDAYQMLKTWLLDDVAAALHQMEVKIEDGCGEYVGFAISYRQISYCVGGECAFDVTMSQTDAAMNCIKKTVISDNWRGEFQNVPANGKKHPRFIYCNEERPNARLIIMWYLIQQLMILSYILLTLLWVILAPLFAVLTVIKGILDAIASILGTDSFAEFIPDLSSLPSYGDLNDYFMSMFVESAGCGREHPAPLIRDYVQNVCDKCGVTVTAQSAPLLFAQTLEAHTIDGVTSIPNPYFNACYLRAEVQRGIRSIQSRSPFFGVQSNNTDYYIPDNAPLETLDMFLDRIKRVFNAEWSIKNNTLYFNRADTFEDPAPLYDFTVGGADEGKLLSGICFEWNETKMPASAKGLWAIDPMDGSGNENPQANGYVMFGNKEINPLFEGLEDMTLRDLASARFRFDGNGPDYITDAMIAVVKFSGVVNLGVQLIAGDQIMKEVDSRINGAAAYALLLQGETLSLPKILIWDGESYEGARCVRDKIPMVTRLVNEPSNVPQIHPDYNDLGGTSGIQSWEQRHTPKGCDTGGIYEVYSLYGGLIANNAARLVNYPLYFEPGYRGTLWDYFHWIKDPRRNPSLNMNWTANIALCCEDMNKLEVYGTADTTKLGAKILVPSNYYQTGTLREIEVVYDVADNLGMHITLKGKV